jgi:hypothetical protein
MNTEPNDDKPVSGMDSGNVLHVIPDSRITDND